MVSIKLYIFPTLVEFLSKQDNIFFINVEDTTTMGIQKEIQ